MSLSIWLYSMAARFERSMDEDSAASYSMKTIFRHSFGTVDDDGFCISIIEVLLDYYCEGKLSGGVFLMWVLRVLSEYERRIWAFVWPCSTILAEYVWQNKMRFSGANVVELGAGTSLPGLVAAKVGANVTLTDDAARLEVLDNMREVCDINGLKCNVVGLTWGLWDPPIFDLCPNIILGADALYETSGFDDLFATVTFLLNRCPGSVFITAYHNRSGHHLIEFLMEKWHLKCTKLLDGFSLMPSHKASSLRENIQLAEIVLDE